MGTDTLLYFGLITFAAEMLGTVGGFGSSLFFVPLAGFFFDFHSVLGITALFHLASNFSKITLFRKGFDKKLIVRMGIPAVVFVIAGSFLSRYFDSRWLQVSLAVFLIGISSLLLLFRKLVIGPNAGNAFAGGALSGFAAGLLGTGGAIRGLTLAAFNLEKEVFVATSAIIDMGVDLSRSIVYFSNGFMHRADLYLVPLLIVVSFIGTYAGKKILERFTQLQFRYTVLILIWVVGLLLLAKILWPGTLALLPGN